jgi:hypothetical protein
MHEELPCSIGPRPAYLLYCIASGCWAGCCRAGQCIDQMLMRECKHGRAKREALLTLPDVSLSNAFFNVPLQSDHQRPRPPSSGKLLPWQRASSALDRTDASTIMPLASWRLGAGRNRSVGGLSPHNCVLIMHLDRRHCLLSIGHTTIGPALSG